MSNCELCGEPMPLGEEMFKYHGYSCECPKPPLPKPPKSEVTIPRAQHEALMAAVQAAKRMRDDLSALELHGDGAHDDSCSICRAIEDFDAAFRDAGIHLAKNVTDPA